MHLQGHGHVVGVWLALASAYAGSILQSDPHLVETTEMEQKCRSELKMIGKHAKDIFHKNREISVLTMKKKQRG
jgi:hypothetical protein